jgi:hypothetical protein
MSASSKSASTTIPSADLAALIKAITALTEQTATNNKLVTALLAKSAALPSAEPASASAPTKGRGKAKKEKVVK